MRKFLIVLLLFVLSAALAGFAQEASGNAASGKKPPVGPDPASKVAAALNAKDLAKSASYYTEDGVVLPPNEPMVKGRAKIEEMGKRWMADGVTDVVILPTTIEVQGDSGYEVADFELTAGTGPQKVRVKGKLLALLKRGSDGQWRMAYELWNSNPAE